MDLAVVLHDVDPKREAAEDVVDEANRRGLAARIEGLASDNSVNRKADLAFRSSIPQRHARGLSQPSSRRPRAQHRLGKRAGERVGGDAPGHARESAAL